MDISIDSKNDIVKMIERHLSLFCSFEHVYLFGSMLKPTARNNDIDILVIYTEYSKRINTEAKLIAEELGRESGMYIDLTVLSEEEEQETDFLEKIKPCYLKLK